MIGAGPLATGACPRCFHLTVQSRASRPPVSLCSALLSACAAWLHTSGSECALEARDTRGRSIVGGGWSSNNNSITMRWQGARLGGVLLKHVFWPAGCGTGQLPAAAEGLSGAIGPRNSGVKWCMHGYWIQQGSVRAQGAGRVEKRASVPRAASAAAPPLSGRQQSTHRQGPSLVHSEGGGRAKQKGSRSSLLCG